MRNLKKFLALALAMVMVVSAAAVVSADFTDVTADNHYADAINDLAVKGIVKGTGDGTTFGPTQDVERYQMALFMARALTGNTDDDAVYQKGIVPFTDVTEYAGAIEYNYVNGIINGWTDITGKLVFAPKAGIQYAQALKMAVCALGYDVALTDMGWAWDYFTKASALGLTENMDLTALDDVLNRAETAQIIYNMLYAAPADGGLTLAERNFDIQTVANTTTFVVTATPKQYYAREATTEEYSSASDVEGTFVGLQELVNGLPAGQMYYFTCEQLGITASEVETYFNRAIELVNFDKATKEFTSVVHGAAPEVVTYDKVTTYDVTDDLADKLVYNGVTYTVDDAITGATLVHEMVMYMDNSSVQTATMLLVDEYGIVTARALASNGAYTTYEAGRYVYSSSTGVKYYYSNSLGRVINETEALRYWGVPVIDEAAEFAKLNTLNAWELDGDAYELKLYDDDHDTLFERAVVTPIYMGVYYTYLWEFDGEERDADGLLYELNGRRATAKYVNYTDKAAQEDGAISVYTYNYQLNTVTVKDVLEVQTGTLKKVNAKGFDDRAADNEANVVKLTIDSKEYTLAYDLVPQTSKVEKWTVDGAILGAEVIEYNEPAGDLAEIADDPFLDIANTKGDISAFIDKLLLKEPIEYVVYGDYIIMANMVDVDEVYDFAVVEGFADFDLGEIYLNLYVGGELEEDAVVSEIAGNELADLSNYKFSMVLSEEELYYPGNIYNLEVAEDESYILDEIIDEDNFFDYGLLNAKVASNAYSAAANLDTAVQADVEDYITDAEDYDYAVDETFTVSFNNGKSVNGAKSNLLRTDDDTVFYFIEDEKFEDLTRSQLKKLKDLDDDGAITEADWNLAGHPAADAKTVTVYVGEPEDGDYITFGEDTQFYTDKLGRGAADVHGVADVVFVVDPVDHNFFAPSPDRVWVFMSMAASNTVEVLDAEEIGLDTEEYEDEYYAYYGNFVNMDDGSKVSVVYSPEKLARNSTYNFILVDENNVAVDYQNEFYPWTSASAPTVYIQGQRDYAHYNIGDVNTTQHNDVTDDYWGYGDGETIYVNDDPTKDVIRPAGTVTVNYFDWLYCHKTGLDYDGFEKVPTSILKVALVDEIIDVDVEDDLYIIENLTNGSFVCDESDNIDTIRVFDLLSEKTGDDALEYLTAAPQIVYMPIADYYEDGVMVFIVATTVADK